MTHSKGGTGPPLDTEGGVAAPNCHEKEIICIVGRRPLGQEALSLMKPSDEGTITDVTGERVTRGGWVSS